MLEGHRGQVLDVAFSPDGEPGAQRLRGRHRPDLDAATGKLERTLRGHAEAVAAAAYSRDGSRVVTAGADATVRVWNVDGERPVIMRGHEGPVNTVEFDRTGERVVSAGADGTVRVWDAAGGETLLLVFTHVGSATGAAFSPDGKDVVSAGSDAVVRFTPCEVCGSLPAVLELARTRAQLELSAADRERFLPRDG